jgi:uncharacterized protein
MSCESHVRLLRTRCDCGVRMCGRKTSTHMSKSLLRTTCPGRPVVISDPVLAECLRRALELPPLTATTPPSRAPEMIGSEANDCASTSEFMPSWMPCQIRNVQHGRADAAINPHNVRRVSGKPTCSQAEVDANAIPIGEFLLSNPHLNNYYLDRSAVLEKITMPVLSCANWGGMGLHSRGNFEAFSRVASEQKWLEVHGLEHWTEFYTDCGVNLQRRFFDHFLKGEDNGWDKGARVQLKVRTPKSFIEREESEWPLARTRWTRFYLDCDAKTLTTSEPSGQQRISFDARSEGVMFKLSPLTEDLEITGPAALKVYVASTTEDADLFVTMHLFDSRGREVLWPTAFEPHGPLAGMAAHGTPRKGRNPLSPPPAVAPSHCRCPTHTGDCLRSRRRDLAVLHRGPGRLPDRLVNPGRGLYP